MRAFFSRNSVIGMVIYSFVFGMIKVKNKYCREQKKPSANAEGELTRYHLNFPHPHGNGLTDTKHYVHAL